MAKQFCVTIVTLLLLACSVVIFTKYQNLLVFFCLMEVQVEVIFLNKIIGTLVTHSLWKQTTFPEAITGFPTKWHLRNECRNSMLTAWPIRSNTQIWVVTCYQYGISAIVSQTTFCEEIVGGFAKCCLFSQASSSQFALFFPLLSCGVSSLIIIIIIMICLLINISVPLKSNSK